MKVVAIVGGIGTGKSTVASYLKTRGAVVIDADSIAHELLDGDKSVREGILSYFGPDIFLASGRVDRKKLGQMAFGDRESLEKLNSILHPRIIEELGREIEETRRSGKRIVVIDAALLLEVDVPFHVDLVIALRCAREEQLRRLRSRGDLTDEDIRLRIENQEHIQKSFYKADAVIDTCRDEAEVLAQVGRLIDALLEGRG